MTGIDWANIGQAIGAIGVMFAAAMGIWKGHKRSDGKPPEDRPPPPNETKAKLDAIHDRLERLAHNIDRHHEMSDDDRRDVSRQLDRLARDMGRICDRLDSDARIGAALAKMGRET